jgi:hypothetical protein
MPRKRRDSRSATSSRGSSSFSGSPRGRSEIRRGQRPDLLRSRCVIIRFASTTLGPYRQVQDHLEDRPGGDEPRLQGQGRDPGPLRRRQDDRSRGQQGRDPPQAFPSRGRVRRPPEPPQHHHGLRLRRRAGQALHRHGAARGSGPEAGPGRGTSHDPRPEAGRDGPDVRRARLRPLPRDLPPRPEAREPAPAGQRQAQDHGLRARAPERLRHDAHRPRDGHAALHVARAGAGRARGRAVRRLRDGLRVLRDPDRQEAVRRGVPSLRPLQGDAGGAASRQRRRPRSPHGGRPGAGEGPGQAAVRPVPGRGGVPRRPRERP